MTYEAEIRRQIAAMKRQPGRWHMPDRTGWNRFETFTEYKRQKPPRQEAA